MMQEELASHEEEREIMQGPANKEETTEPVIFENFT
jgi:hypothetical protein